MTNNQQFLCMTKIRSTFTEIQIYLVKVSVYTLHNVTTQRNFIESLCWRIAAISSQRHVFCTTIYVQFITYVELIAYFIMCGGRGQLFQNNWCYNTLFICFRSDHVRNVVKMCYVLLVYCVRIVILVVLLLFITSYRTILR